MDIAVVDVGVNLVLGSDGVCSNAHAAPGAVAPMALLVPDVAKADEKLLGRTKRQKNVVRP